MTYDELIEQTREHGRNKHFDEALKFLSDTACHWFWGDCYAKKGDLGHAIADRTKAIELSPNNDAFYYNRGFSYNREGDHDLAIADYSEAIRINPNYAKAYYNRADAYTQKNNCDLAAVDRSKAAELYTK